MAVYAIIRVEKAYLYNIHTRVCGYGRSKNSNDDALRHEAYR